MYYTELTTNRYVENIVTVSIAQMQQLFATPFTTY